MVKEMSGEEHVLLSADSVEHGDYPEFLNTLNISGLPLHEITVKVGAVLMLLRNLDKRSGLYNGTRFIVTAVHSLLLEGAIVTAGEFAGKKIMVPRITLKPSDSRFPFTLCRRQFPVSLAFGMAINKSQGQTLGPSGVYLPHPVFGHGQLFVALQGRFAGQSGVYTRNVVFREVLG